MNTSTMDFSFFPPPCFHSGNGDFCSSLAAFPRDGALSLSLCSLLTKRQPNSRSAEGSGNAEVLKRGAPVLLGCRLVPGGSRSLDAFTKRSCRSSAGPGARDSCRERSPRAEQGIKPDLSQREGAVWIPPIAWCSWCFPLNPAGVELYSVLLCSCE